MRSPYFESLSNFQTLLAAQYRDLRQQRSGLPVFLIEHGLEAVEVSELLDLVGRNLRAVGLNSLGWMGAELPLAVAITEIGYSYRGTGTDFWPRISASLKADIGTSERPFISRIFESLSKKHGIAKPYDTDWSRAYNHIAWPIRNALAPVEIHRPLVEALREVLTTTVSLQSDVELIANLRNIAAGLWSRRLSDWLEDEELALNLSRRLLGGEEYQTWLEPRIARRISDDLRADPTARRSLSSAQRKAGRHVSAAPTLPPPARYLLAMSDGQLDRLVIRGPDISVTQKEELFGIFGESSKVCLTEKNTIPTFLSDFLSGGILDLGKPEQAPGSRPCELISYGDTELAGSFVGAIQPELPCLFHWAESSGFLEAISAGTSLPEDGKFIWIIWGEHAKYTELEELPAWNGVQAFILDSSSQLAQPFFGRLGFDLDNPPLIDFSGGIALNLNGQSLTSIGEFPIFCRALHDQLRIEINSSIGERVASSSQGANKIWPMQLAPGRYRLLAATTDKKTSYEVHILAPEAPEPVDCEIEPPTPHFDDFMTDDLSLTVSSPIAFEQLEARLSIIGNGRLLKEETQWLDSIPARIGARSTAMRELKAAIIQREEHSSDTEYRLRLVLPGLGEFDWQLPRRSRMYEFDEDRSLWNGPDDEKIAASKVAQIDAPLLVSDLNTVAHRVEKLTLIIPDGERDGSLLSGRLYSPMLMEMGQTFNFPALDLARSAASPTTRHGLFDVVEAMVAWSSALATNFYADRLKLQVLNDLERSLVKILCGENWLKVEKAGDGFRGNALDAFVTICIDRGLASGEGFPATKPEEFQIMREFLAKRFKAIVPDFSNLALDDEVVEALDFAVMDAYDKDLRHYRLEQGRDAPDEIDIGFSMERWRRAIHDALIKAERPGFRHLVLPDRRWQAISEQRYSAISLDQLVDILAGVHLDVSRRSGVEWINRRVIKAGLQLWIAPRQLIETSGWRDDLQRLLSDRQTARAIRYSALRLQNEMNSVGSFNG